MSASQASSVSQTAQMTHQHRDRLINEYGAVLTITVQPTPTFVTFAIVSFPRKSMILSGSERTAHYAHRNHQHHFSRVRLSKLTRLCAILATKSRWTNTLSVVIVTSRCKSMRSSAHILLQKVNSVGVPLFKQPKAGSTQLKGLQGGHSSGFFGGKREGADSGCRVE